VFKTPVLTVIGLLTILLLNDGSVVNYTLMGFNFNNAGGFTEAIITVGTQLPPVKDTTGTAEATPVTENKSPTSAAGPDRVLYEGDEVILDGTDSIDQDGTIEEYSWILEDTDDDCDPVTGSLQDTNQAKAKFLAPNEIPQQECNYYYQLEVTDNNGLIDSDAVNVKVQNTGSGIGNKPPMSNAGKDRQVQEGDTVTLDGTDSMDEDGTIVSYKWNIEEWDDEDPAGKLSNTNSATPKFTAPSLKDPPGIYGIDLTVEDNDGGMDTDTILVRVNAKSITTSSQTNEDSNAGVQDEPALLNKSKSKLVSYVERTFQLNPFTLSCSYDNQTQGLAFCNVVCCNQSNNITAFAQPNASSVSQEILLNQLLNNSLVFLNKTNIVGKLVPLNETESVTSPNATSLLLPFLLRNSSNVTNNQTGFQPLS
jgi:hypothetical protein